MIWFDLQNVVLERKHEHTSLVCLQSRGAWATADTVQVPLHLQPSRPVSSLSRLDDDDPRPLWQAAPVPESLAQRVRPRLLRSTHQRGWPRNRQGTCNNLRDYLSYQLRDACCHLSNVIENIAKIFFAYGIQSVVKVRGKAFHPPQLLSSVCIVLPPKFKD